MSEKNKSINNITLTEKKFFTLWVMLFSPFLGISNKEQDLLVMILYFRYKLSKDIKNEEMLNNMLFSTAVRKQIRDELKWKESSFNNILSFLRTKSIITENKIKSKIVPEIDADNFSDFEFVYKMSVSK